MTRRSVRRQAQVDVGVAPQASRVGEGQSGVRACPAIGDTIGGSLGVGEAIHEVQRVKIALVHAWGKGRHVVLQRGRLHKGSEQQRERQAQHETHR